MHCLFKCKSIRDYFVTLLFMIPLSHLIASALSALSLLFIRSADEASLPKLTNKRQRKSKLSFKYQEEII